MRVLLDTSTFLWAVSEPERLSPAAKSVLGAEATVREISVVSFTEIAIEQSRGKLLFRKEDLAQGVDDLRLHVMPYTANHAYKLFELPLHHADPFDRQLIAQALAEGIPLVSSDQAFHSYKGLNILW